MPWAHLFRKRDWPCKTSNLLNIVGNIISYDTICQRHNILPNVRILGGVYFMEWNDTEHFAMEQNIQVCQFASQKF